MDTSASLQPHEDQFSAVWPELARRLARVLHSRRVPADLVDDLVQETGLRLFRNWSKVDQTTLWALANTILLNLVRDEVRKNEVRKRDAGALVAERARNFDEEMLSRLELRRVEKVLRKLSDIDQQVLLAEWGEASDLLFTSPAALKMARMRARQRLRAALEHASGLVPAWWRIRRVALSRSPATWNISEQLSQLAAAGVLVVAGVVGSVMGVTTNDAGSAVRRASGPTHLLAADTEGGRSERHARQPLSAGTRLEVGSGAGARAGAPQAGPDEPDLNEEFGPLSNDDGEVVVGEGGHGLGPYGADRTVEASPAGRKAKARARARYDGPRCEGELVIGGTVGESEPECEPGESSAGVETEAEGQHHEAETP